MSNIPVVKQIAWVSLFTHIAVFLGLYALLHAIAPEQSIFLSVIVYVVLSFGLRFFLTSHHRKGMKLIHMQLFKEAIPHFEESVAFYTRHSWVDKYRYLTLLASSKMTYREMGLCNIAFCESQLGHGQKAKQLYETIVAEYPENGIALTALGMIRSIESGN